MWKEFKPALVILLRFAVIFLVIFGLYQWYLTATESLGLDPYSRWVASQVNGLQNLINYPSQLYHITSKREEWFWVKGNYVSYMVEGCNAISVMILFIAFVLAFYKSIKTFFFILGGLVAIHFMNVARITMLNIVLSDWPEYGKIAHDYFFPAIIYGFVVFLWLIWINKFAIKN